MDKALNVQRDRRGQNHPLGPTGTGCFDMTVYESYLSGAMADYVPTDEDLQKGFDSLPNIPQNQGI